MDTEKLASLVATADAGTLSAAASRLGTQISTVSRHIRDLERDLGARLFDRTGRGVRLTPAGERLLEHARDVLRAVERALAAARTASPKEPSQLRLSVPPDFGATVLPGALAALMARHPKLRVEARAEARRVSLVEESYDAVVRLGTPPPSELIARRIGTVELVLCARPGVTVKGARSLSSAEFVLVEGVPDALAAKERGRAVRVALSGRVRLSTFRDAAEVAARSDALVLVSSVTAKGFLESGRLVRVARELRFPAVPVHLLRPERLRGSAILEELCALLKTELSA